MKAKVFYERLKTSGELTRNGGIYKATKVPAPHKGKQQRRGTF